MENEELTTMKVLSEQADSVTSNPVTAIQQEVEKAKRAPKRVGLLSIKSANAWIEDSINLHSRNDS